MYIPVMTDMAHMAKNIGSSLNMGFNIPGHGIKSYGTNIGSVGGALSAFGLAPIGAIAGAAIGSQVTGDNVLQNAGIGAAVGFGAGALALPTVGLAARGAVGLGKVGINAGAALVNNTPGIVGGAADLALGMLGPVAYAGRRFLGKAAFDSQFMVKWDIPTETLGRTETKSLLGRVTHTGGIKLSAEGLADLWGGALAIGMTGAFKEVMKRNMGQMDGQVRRATPRVPAYADNAGATGDLVFALNRNRRG
jgi:hypothetical protein